MELDGVLLPESHPIVVAHIRDIDRDGRGQRTIKRQRSNPRTHRGLCDHMDACDAIGKAWWSNEFESPSNRRIFPGLQELTLRECEVLHIKGVELCGIVTFTVDGHPAESVQAHLRANGINVSMSRAPMAQLDLGHRQIPEVVRASTHYFNTEAELERTLSSLAKLRV